MPHPPRFTEITPRRPTARDQAREQAMFALQMGRPADAERILAEVLKSNRNDSWALQALGHALVMQGRAAEAVSLLERAVRKSADPAIETQLAMALRAAGRNDDALNRLRQAIARRPPYPPAFLELGRQLGALDRHEQAVDALKQGLALAPEFADLWIELGYSLAVRNARTEAGAAFTRALALAPDRIDAISGLAQVLQREGDHAGAADLYRRLLGLKPDDAAARLGLGACLLELQQAEQARNSLRAAARTGPKMLGQAIGAMMNSAHGRFWLRPSDAARFLRGE